MCPRTQKTSYTKHRVLEEDGLSWHVYDLHHARLFNDRGHFCAFNHAGEVLDEEARWQTNTDPTILKDVHQYICQSKEPRPHRLPGTVACLYAPYASANYYHWMFDTLPRLELLHRYNPDLDPDHYLFHWKVDLPYKKETLDILGVPERKRLGNSHHHHISCDRLWFTEHPRTEGQRLNKTQSPWIPHFLRKTFLPLAGPPPGMERIYIERKDSKMGRHILNNDAVLAMLSKYGIRPVVLSSLSLKEQITLFKHVKLVVGLHGAGLTNLVFSNPGIHVVEMFSTNHRRPYFLNLCATLGIHHAYLPQLLYDPTKRPIQADLTIDLPSLEKAVSAATEQLDAAS
jgi:capsular polysaccharide biosynthesis protein